MTIAFVTALDHVFQIEGGFTDDPADSGGPTRWGITQTVARRHGYAGLMAALPQDTARRIYEDVYWTPVMGDTLAGIFPPLAEEVFDSAVNMGVGRASEFLQRSLNVLNRRGKDYADIRVDGDIGHKTILALRSYSAIRSRKGMDVLVVMLNALQGAFYVTLAERREKDERFVYGWFANRVLIN